MAAATNSSFDSSRDSDNSSYESSTDNGGGYSSRDSDSSSNESSTRNGGGYSFELVDNKFEAKFTCIVCQLFIREFTEVGCGNGHAGCRYCIDEWEERRYRSV